MLRAVQNMFQSADDGHDDIGDDDDSDGLNDLDSDGSLFIDHEMEDCANKGMPSQELVKALPVELLERAKMFQQELQHQETEIQQQQAMLARRLEGLSELKLSVEELCTFKWKLALKKCEATALDARLLQSGKELVETVCTNTQTLLQLSDATCQNDMDALITALDHARQAQLQDAVIRTAQERLAELMMKDANIVFSVKYTVKGPTAYAQLLTDYLRNSRGLYTHNPNEFTKKDCGQECSITGYGCTKVPYAPNRKPNDGDCWQSSFRWHLEYPERWGKKGKKAVMLRVKEGDTWGAGQVIERKMTENLGILCIEVAAPSAASSIDFVSSFPDVLKQVEQKFTEHGIF